MNLHRQNTLDTLNLLQAALLGHVLFFFLLLQGRCIQGLEETGIPWDPQTQVWKLWRAFNAVG